MIDKRRRSPLAHRAPIGAADMVYLREYAFNGKLILRVSAADIKQELPLPLTPNRSSDWEDISILWLGPDEWMFVMPPGGEGAIQAKLGEILSRVHHQLTDVTDYYTTLQLSGTRAPETLMKLTMFDLHRRAFKPGDVAGTVFGKTAAWIINTSDDTPQFDIIVRWSMADYLWCLIAEAGREFGMPVQSPAGQVKGLRYKA